MIRLFTKYTRQSAKRARTRDAAFNLSPSAMTKELVSAGFAKFDPDGTLRNPDGSPASVSGAGIPALNTRAAAINGAAFPGVEYSALTSTTGWAVTTTGTGGSVAATTMADGQPGLLFTVNPGVATAYITLSASDAAIAYDQTTTIGLWVEIADAGRSAGVTILVSNETGQTFTNWVTLTHGASGGAVFRGLYFLNVCIADASAGGGTFATAGTIKSIRIRLNSSYKDQGATVKVRSLRVNSLARPKIALTFDDCYASAFTEGIRYASRYGIVGTLAVNTSLIGTANYMTLAQLQAAYSMGWHVCGHTPSHGAFNSNSTNAIATTQTPGGAGNLTLDGAVGTASFDAPRHVVVRAASDQGRKLTITGLDEFGAALVEDLYPWTGSYPVPTQALFSKVNSIAIDAAATGTITVGTSLSRAQMSSALTTVRDWLIANGMPGGANDFVFPQGEFNNTALALLTSLGFRSARTVQGALQSPQVGDIRRFELAGFGGGGAAVDATALSAYRSKAIRQGQNTIIYLHELIQSGSPTATQTLVAQWQTFIDACAADVAAGKCDMVTQYELPVA